MNERETSGTEGTVRVYFWRGRVLYLGPVDDVEVHSHHAVQAAVSPSGSFEIGIGDETVRTQAVLIETDRPHRLDSLGQNTAIFLIDPESIDATRLRRGCLKTCGHHVIGADLAEPMIDALSVMDNSDAGCTRAAGCFERLLETWGEGPGPLPERDSRIDRALAFIQALPEKRVSLSDLAANVHLSEGRFIHLFTEHVGIPPRRYLLWARLMDALEAVFRGENLTTAAHEVGFADSAHLSRTFKRMFGLAPSFLSAGNRNSQFVQAYLCTDIYL